MGQNHAWAIHATSFSIQKASWSCLYQQKILYQVLNTFPLVSPILFSGVIPFYYTTSLLSLFVWISLCAENLTWCKSMQKCSASTFSSSKVVRTHKKWLCLYIVTFVELENFVPFWRCANPAFYELLFLYYMTITRLFLAYLFLLLMKRFQRNLPANN